MLTAIILAAGKAKRMGTLKQLLPWQGDKTILQTVVDTVLTSPLVDDGVLVVTGAQGPRVSESLEQFEDKRLQVINNPHYEKGMLSSIRIGLNHMPQESQAFMVVLGDQPLIGPEIISCMARQWLKSKPDFLLPIKDGRRGHPVIVHRKYLSEILDMEDTQGGLRELIHKYSQRVKHWQVDDEAIHIDLDYPEDYQRYRPEEGKG